MKRTVSKLIAVVLAMALVMSTLSACGSKNASKGSGKELTDLVTWETQAREMETINILYSQESVDSNVLCNCVEGLLESDSYGKLVPGIAEKWGTEDNGLTWTFNIRKGVKWVDKDGNVKADCTAQDFITGLEWILNYYKNESANTSMPIELIKGAKEYYEYTKSLSKEEAYALDSSKMLEMVGISAPDDYTLKYTCTSQKPYFDTVTVYSCLFPASKALIDELGVDGFRGMTYDKLWSNGPYRLTEFISGNEKVLTKNDSYWDKDCKLFNTVTIKMVESLDSAFLLYQSGELDTVDLTQANLKTIYENKDNEFNNQLVEKMPKNRPYQFHWNYSKKNADGTADTNWNTAIANLAFRQSLYYGLDLTEYFKRTNDINPYECEYNTYTINGLCYLSDGTEYTDLVKKELGLKESDGKSMARLDKTKADALKKQAMEELKAKGVTFPVEFDYYIQSSSQTAADNAVVLQNIFKNTLGEDYIKLNVKTYVSSVSKEVFQPKLESFQIAGWGADYGDPQNYLGQETYGQDNAYYSTHLSNINEVTDPDLIATLKEYTKMVNDANAINDDLDARYKAYAKAEAYLIENAITMPAYIEVSWQLTHVNDYTKLNAKFGSQSYMYKNWETSEDGYTKDQYEQFKTDYANGSSK
jgi:oligopeptide transport system substrate-binding protein